MPIRDTKLNEGYAPLSATEAYKVPPATITKITKVQAYNSDTGPRELTVHIVPSGDSATSENKVVSVSLEADESKLISELMLEILYAKDSIVHSCDVGDKVTVRYNGRETSIP